MGKLVEGVEQVVNVFKSSVGRLDKFGRELLDGRPMAPPVGYKKQPSMMDNIREMVRSERLRQEVEAAGAETFEESNDFFVEDDPFPESAHEFRDEDYELEEEVAVVTEAAKKGVKVKAAKKAEEPPPPPPPPPTPVKPPEA